MEQVAMASSPVTSSSCLQKITSNSRAIIATLIVSTLQISRMVVGASIEHWLLDITDNSEEYEERYASNNVLYITSGMAASLFFAFLSERFSRKTCLHFLCSTYIIASIFLLSGKMYWLYQVAKPIVAVSYAGTRIISTIYISEISPDHMRGGLVAIPALFTDLVFVASDFAAKYLYTFWIPLVISSSVSGCMHFWLPESPIYLLRRQDAEGAKRSLQWLRGSDANVSEEIEMKLNSLKATRSDRETSTTITQECINRRTMRYFGIAFTLELMLILTDYSYINHEAWKFRQIKHVAILFFENFNNFALLVADMIAIVTCDYVGRRILLLISAFGCSTFLVASGICYLVMGGEDYKVLGVANILTLLFSGFYTFSLSVGIGTLTDVVYTDLFQPKILNTQLAILSTIHFGLAYALYLNLFDIMVSAMGTYGVFWLFGVAVALGALLTFKFLPETKNQTPGYLFTNDHGNEAILFSGLEDEID